jgi:hypothetical protein
MKTLFLPFLLSAFSTFLLISCDKDDPIPDPDPDPDPKVENIASYVKILFEPIGDTITPPAAYPYIISEIEEGRWTSSSRNLKKNRSYDVTIVMEDRRTSPVKDINQLVLSKADEYQLFIKTNETLIQLEAVDKDSKGLPIGLQWRATTGAEIGLGNTVDVVLIHAPGTKNGTPTVGKKVLEYFAFLSVL